MTPHLLQISTCVSVAGAEARGRCRAPVAAGSGMHILAFAITVLAAVGFWIWRVRAADEAAGDLADVPGHVRGAYRRRQFRLRAEASSLAAITDPAQAAAVLLVAIATEEGRLSEEIAGRIGGWLADVAGVADPAEMLVFARWAARQAHGAEDVAWRTLPLLRRSLGEVERGQLLAMAGELAEPLNNPVRREILQVLRNGLSLP
jgi:hypothetical protein